MKLKKGLTKLAFKTHSWLGLTAGIFFLLFGFSGSALVFRHDLDRYFNPELHHLKQGPQIVPVDSIYRMIVRTHPDLKKIVLHDFPMDKQDSYEFMLYKNQQRVTDNYLSFAFVDPYTGKILKEGSYGDISPSFFRWLYSFHYNLQAGMPGMLFTAVIGLIMLLSLITGIVIYRRHLWDALRFRLNFSSKRRTISSLHRLIGVWSVLFTAILFFTGFWMNMMYFKPSAWKINKLIPNYIIPVSIDKIIEQSHLIKGFEPIAVTLPTNKGMDVVVKGHFSATSFFLFQGKASSVFFDAETGKLKNTVLIDNQSFSNRFEWQVYQLHIGAYGNDLVRWLYVLLGLCPGILSITGAILWFKRKF